MSKIFFLTGSARGLGRSLAEAILAAGHRLIATARRPERLQALVQRYGDRILPLTLDVGHADAARLAVEQGVRVFGAIDVLINNAGCASVGAVEDMPLEAIAAQFDTNVMGSIRVIQAVLPVFRQQGAGRVIQMASVSDRIANPGVAAFYASQWALAGLLESLAQEVAPLGIKVTVCEPGAMRTDFARDNSLTIFPSHPAYDPTVGDVVEMIGSPEFLASLGDPARVAEAVLKVAALHEPPLRLLLGSAMYAMGTEADRARAAADAKWQWLSRSVDEPAHGWQTATSNSRLH
ncbi:MAG: SDR family NAD(P)-dependent oxidoreductase [Pseudomonadota bacterium]